MWAKLIIFALMLVEVLCEGRISYQNYKVHKITPHTKFQVEVLRRLEKTNAGFSFWSNLQGIGKPVHIMVPPHQRLIFQDLVTLNKLQDVVYIEDVQHVIDSQVPRNRAAKFNFENYYRTDEVKS